MSNLSKWHNWETNDRWDNLFDKFFEGTALATHGHFPNKNYLDHYVEGDNEVFKFDLPGFTEDEVNVEYKDGMITIKADKKEEESSKKYYSKKSNSVQYSIKTEKDFDDSTCVVTLKDGVLSLSIPTYKEPEPKKIEVKKIEVNKSIKGS